ncbi:hypothetical protein NM208_g12940 [Fusarium decemcellulare]|uniref:Uncharacterized protein n=1 Tax=Fusarium decemcellulare TaxID=57161 RepID=A0ACC1RNQ5_9HYPO|nr:hypothetical protein NM208_g12940 [Fusarium decemcellulare]
MVQSSLPRTNDIEQTSMSKLVLDRNKVRPQSLRLLLPGPKLLDNALDLRLLSPGFFLGFLQTLLPDADSSPDIGNHTSDIVGRVLVVCMLGSDKRLAVHRENFLVGVDLVSSLGALVNQWPQLRLLLDMHIKERVESRLQPSLLIRILGFDLGGVGKASRSFGVGQNGRICGA